MKHKQNTKHNQIDFGFTLESTKQQNTQHKNTKTIAKHSKLWMQGTRCSLETKYGSARITKGVF